MTSILLVTGIQLNALMTRAWMQPSFRLQRGLSRLSSTLTDVVVTPPKVPKAAVAVSVRCRTEHEEKFLLIQRGKAPNKGMWSVPGGSLDFGEPALDGAIRELDEETQWNDPEIYSQLQWYPTAICTSDSIADGYHYVIAQFFAEIQEQQPEFPKISPQDDAADTKWYSLDEIEELCYHNHATAGILVVLNRIQELSRHDLLPTAPRESTTKGVTKF